MMDEDGGKMKVESWGQGVQSVVICDCARYICSSRSLTFPCRNTPRQSIKQNSRLLSSQSITKNDKISENDKGWFRNVKNYKLQTDASQSNYSLPPPLKSSSLAIPEDEKDILHNTKFWTHPSLVKIKLL